MPCPFQWLAITDGTTDSSGKRNQVDLLSPSGFCLLGDGDWRPAISEPKGGGVWRDSQLSEGRRPSDFKGANVLESITLAVMALDQDQLIRDTQELRRLLTKARTYGTTEWQTEPVWLEAKAPGETNIRYAMIWDWRTPHDSNPYEEPFWQVVARAGMDDFVLILEREPYWRSDVPGTSSCLEIAGYNTYCWPCHIEFVGGADPSTKITITDNAVIQDLHDAAMTVEMWVAMGTSAWFPGTVYFAYKSGGAAQGWRMAYTTPTTGIEVTIECATTDGYARTGIEELTTDEEWHHIAFTWDDASYNYPRIWVDGEEATYLSTTNRNGAIVSDVGNDLIIGSTGGANYYAGNMGWTRISNSIRYNGPFTPPLRCTLPEIDGNTVGQWIGAECLGTTIDNQEGTAAIDGTLAVGLFDCDCEHYYGNVTAGTIEPTCEEEVYVANKQNKANITHVFTWSAANGFSGNLIGTALPWTLIDTVGVAPAVNDYIVFGINTLLLDSGPFASLVFNLSTALSGMTLIWENSTGGPGWAALTAQDNTDQDGAMTGSPLDTAGVNSVHWKHPGAWATQPENGVTGYWVRARITAAPGPIVAPVQQTEEVYTITWANMLVDDDTAAGDVPPLARVRVTYQARDNWRITNVIAGLRSTNRGGDFSAYINLADEQNPTGVTVAAAGGAAIGNDILAPTGRSTSWAAVAAIATRATVSFSAAMSQVYMGRYHVFVRTNTSGVGADTATVRLRYKFGPEQFSPTVTLGLVDYQVSDLGIVSLGGNVLDVGSESFTAPTIDVQVSNTGAGTIYLYDVVLIPIDEYSTICTRPTANDERLEYGRMLDIDSIYPKRTKRALIREADTETVSEIWIPVQAGPTIIQSNAEQRLWFLSYGPTFAIPGVYGDSQTAHTILMQKVLRYYSMRGDR